MAMHLLDDANGDVTVAIELGIAQDQSEEHAHEQIKAERKAAQLDSPHKAGTATPDVIDLTDSPMDTPKEDSECMYTYVGTKQARPTNLGTMFMKQERKLQHDPPTLTLSELFAQETKRHATATSTMQGLEELERLRLAYEQDQKTGMTGVWRHGGHHCQRLHGQKSQKATFCIIC